LHPLLDFEPLALVFFAGAVSMTCISLRECYAIPKSLSGTD
jgi:hypothetical protein